MSFRFAIFVLAFPLATSVFAEDAKPNLGKGFDFFEAKIRPVLVKHCLDCHSAEAGVTEGNLRLDTRAGLRKGGDRGPAVVPFKPESSLLLKAISHADAKLKMPPKENRLPEKVIADFQTWIKQGAPDRAKNPLAKKHGNQNCPAEISGPIKPPSGRKFLPSKTLLGPNAIWMPSFWRSWKNSLSRRQPMPSPPCCFVDCILI